jgi:hypothetical protein
MKGKRKHSTVRVRSAQLLTVLLVVGLAVTALATPALAQTDPYLFVGDVAGDPVDVNLHDGTSSFWAPIRLETASKKISAVAFGLTYDASCLAFDSATDSNNDGVPDSVRKTHGDFDYSVRHTGNQIVVVIRGTAQGTGGAMKTMDLVYTDKKVTEIQFNVLPGCRTTDGNPVTVDFDFVVNNGRPRLPSIADEWGRTLTSPPLANHVVDGSYILHFNAEPTTVLLNGGTEVDFAEEQPAGTVVGTLSNDDPDSGDTHTYTFWNCTDNDNFAFSIAGDQLKSKGPFDYEDDVVLGPDHSFKVCVRVTDSYGLHADGTFTVHVTDVNEPGEDIHLSSTHVNEHEPVGTVVGVLSTLGDPDEGDSHTYDLPGSPPAGCAGPDNASFQIDGDQLRTAEEFDVLTKGDTYLICVSSTDTGSLVIYQAFTITVDDENDPPVAYNDPDDQLILANTGDPYTFYVLRNDFDPEGDDLIVGSVTQPAEGGVVTLVDGDTAIEFTPAAGYSGPVEFTYKAKEDRGPWLEGLESNEATVVFFVVNDDDRGDCNNDGEIDAADFSAIQLEIWDTNNPLDWRLIYLGDYNGSPVGCDANSSRNGLDGTQPSVDIADVTCTVRLFFGEECTPIMGAASLQSAASLRVGSPLQIANGGTVAVPVALDTAGQSVASAAFILEFDPALFGVDPADADGNGIPDAVAFTLPDSFAKSVLVDNEQGQIKVAVFGTSMPLPLLHDGVIATVTLYGKASVMGQSIVGLERVSLGSDQGQSLTVVSDSGIITFGAANSSLFLPLLQMP